jgi:hypothetical protein
MVETPGGAAVLPTSRGRAGFGGFFDVLQELLGKLVQPSGYKQQAAEEKQGTAEYFDAGQNDRILFFPEFEAVDAVNPESSSFPDDLPPPVTLDYVQRNFDGQVIWPELKGKTGASRHFLTL